MSTAAMSEPGIERIFLGWDGPMLPRAAKWLRDQRGESGPVCDLSDIIAVTPGARAGRRLLELLVEHGGVLTPPTIITAGQLPEHLYEPAAPIADDLTAALVRLHALASAPAADIAALIPHPPAAGDLTAWLALARQLAALDETLAGGHATIDDAIRICQQHPDFNDEARWSVIAALQREYVRALGDAGCCDVYEARRAAIAKQNCRTQRGIILIATTDLNRQTQMMLRQAAARHGACITALVHAPDSEAAGFDDLGCLNADHWRRRAVAIPDDCIHIAGEPRDQAMRILQMMSEQRDGAPSLASHYTADEITLGLGDERLAGLLERCLSLADVPVHSALGRPLASSRPATLLRGVGDFARQHRLDAFAALLRHPDVEAFLHHTIDADADAASPPEAPRAAEHWLTLLDDYITARLVGATPKQWLGDPPAATRLKAVHDAVLAALPEDAAPPRPLPQWAEAIAQLLTAVYAKTPLRDDRADDQHLARAMMQINSALVALSQLPADAPFTPVVAFAEAVNVLLAQLESQQLPAERIDPRPAVELLGWLELQLDDAPALLITGFNEHHVPASQSADAFLPQHVRKALGLPDNAHRYARDAAALEAIVRSRAHLSIIAGRRGADGEPLPPSRLLLTGDATQQAQRLMRFYPEDPAADVPAAPLLLAPGTASRFLIPPPRPPKRPLTKLPVTAFRTYLHCPYRFYLQYIERLAARDDRAMEIDGRAFGTLAHRVLGRFGKSEVRHAVDARDIEAFLLDALASVAMEEYSQHAPMAARVQMRMLTERLRAFAAWQADQAAAGWRIAEQFVEEKLAMDLDVDDEAMTVTGRIDRIDRHENTGAVRIIDYKSGDKPTTPKEAHIKGGEWIDLQLPLYHAMWRAMRNDDDADAPIELGYILLPKDLKQIGFAEAPWNEAELADAMEKAEQVVRNIRGGVFWPPREDWRYEDEFTDLCMERHPQWLGMRRRSLRNAERESADA